jgi:hypothetical protein
MSRCQDLLDFEFPEFRQDYTTKDTVLYAGPGAAISTPQARSRHRLSNGPLSEHLAQAAA